MCAFSLLDREKIAFPYLWCQYRIFFSDGSASSLISKNITRNEKDRNWLMLIMGYAFASVMRDTNQKKTGK